MHSFIDPYQEEIWKLLTHTRASIQLIWYLYDELEMFLHEKQNNKTRATWDRAI